MFALPTVGRTSRSFRLALALSCLIALGSIAALTNPTRGATTFVVNRIGDQADLNLANTKCDTSSASGTQCTLRAAIQEASDTAGADTINFNIKSASKVITPASPLPPITGRVTINGYSQSGASTNSRATGNNAVLRIVLDGINAGANANGLEIEASNSVVRGLVIQRFQGSGILVKGSSNQIVGNLIGTNAAGTLARGNGTGMIVGGPDNHVGGTSNAARNLISGNLVAGVLISGADATGNHVENNYIGTKKGGGAALGNGSTGVLVQGADGTVVGGTSAAARNVIAGNVGDGVHLRSLFDGAPVLVQGNFIGTDATGTIDLGNGGNGVRVDAASNSIIGGTVAGARNVISGNAGEGLQVVGFDNVVQGNFIGTDVTGTLPLGNDGNGIEVFLRNLIGGAVAGAGNVISDNGVDGIQIILPGDANTGVVIQGNRIGTKADGTGDLGNAGNGINIFGHDNTIGGPGAAANVIGGNDANGVRIAGGFATGNIVAGNVIRANTQQGARIEFGPNAVTGNVIFQNGANGVRVSFSAKGIEILGNQLFANGALGIDLIKDTTGAGAGVSPNDTDDPDTGGNELQNFPVITSAVRDQSAGFTTVTVTLNSNPSTQFRVDVYVAQADPSNHGEGQFLAHSQTVTTSAGGDVSFSFASAQIVAGQVLTATALNTTSRDTSEFSQNRTVTQVP